MPTFYVHGTYCTKSGAIGRFTYPAVAANTASEAIGEAAFKVRKRKAFAGKLDATARINQEP